MVAQAARCWWAGTAGAARDEAGTAWRAAPLAVWRLCMRMGAPTPDRRIGICTGDVGQTVKYGMHGPGEHPCRCQCFLVAPRRGRTPSAVAFGPAGIPPADPCRHCRLRASLAAAPCWGAPPRGRSQPLPLLAGAVARCLGRARTTRGVGGAAVPFQIGAAPAGPTHVCTLRAAASPGPPGRVRGRGSMSVAPRRQPVRTDALPYC